MCLGFLKEFTFNQIVANNDFMDIWVYLAAEASSPRSYVRKAVGIVKPWGSKVNLDQRHRSMGCK